MLHEIYLQNTAGEEFVFYGELISQFDGKELFKSEQGKYFLKEPSEPGTDTVLKYSNGIEDLIGSLLSSPDTTGHLFEYFMDEGETYGNYVKRQNREFITNYLLLALAGPEFADKLVKDKEDLDVSLTYIMER